MRAVVMAASTATTVATYVRQIETSGCAPQDRTCVRETSAIFHRSCMLEWDSGKEVRIKRRTYMNMPLAHSSSVRVLDVEVRIDEMEERREMRQETSILCSRPSSLLSSLLSLLSLLSGSNAVMPHKLHGSCNRFNVTRRDRTSAGE